MTADELPKVYDLPDLAPAPSSDLIPAGAAVAVDSGTRTGRLHPNPPAEGGD